MTESPRPYLRHGAGGQEALHLTAEDLPKSLDAAYRALAGGQSAEPDTWVAWKLGGTNHASRAAFGVDRLYYGAIARQEIVAGSPGAAGATQARLPGFPLFELKGEVEIALRVDAAGTGFDAWCVALEMPSSALADLLGLGVVALVADRCAAGALILGPVFTGPLPGPGAHFVQRINGEIKADSGFDALVDTPPALLADFLAMAGDHGAPVRPGDWVATGGITPCLGYAAGDRVAILLDGQVMIDGLIGV